MPENKKCHLLGPSHHVAFKGAALPKTDYFVTPLGAVQVNKELSAALTSQPGFKFFDLAHKNEHKPLEVQLPFLQKVLKKY